MGVKLNAVQNEDSDTVMARYGMLVPHSRLIG